METTPFDLNLAIERWRHDWAAEISMGRETLDEIEAHLRDSVSALLEVGLTPEEAFLVARSRVGSPAQLASEFAKVEPRRAWMLRCGWMAAGVGLYLLATSLATIVSAALVLMGNRWGMETVALGWTGLAGRTLVLGTALTAVLALARGRCGMAGNVLAGCSRQPMKMAALVLTLMILVAASATVAPILLAMELNPARLGSVFLMSAWANAVAPFLLSGLLCAYLGWMGRRASHRGRGLAVALVAGSILLGLGIAGPTRSQAATVNDTTLGEVRSAGLDRVLALWRAGKKGPALAQFGAVDFSRRPLFAGGSILGYTEKQFMGLPSAVREKLKAEMLLDLRALKEIAAEERDRGRAELAQGREAEAQRRFDHLKRCGKALDQPESLALLRVVGTSLQKFAAEAAMVAPAR